MGKKQQSGENEGAMFPVRFDIKVASEEETKKIQGLFAVRGENMNLAEVRKQIYEAGLKTFHNALKKLKQLETV